LILDVSVCLCQVCLCPSNNFRSMSDLAKIISGFLADTFAPITLSAPVKEWRSLNYSNRLFSVSLSPEYSYYQKYPSGYKSVVPEISIRGKTFEHPGLFIGSVVGDVKTYFKLVDVDGNPVNVFTEEDENKIACIHTEGKTVERFVRMIKDFGMTLGEISGTLPDDPFCEEVEANKNEWLKIVESHPEKTLRNLQTTADSMAVKCMSLTINKAPDYSKAKSEYYEIFSVKPPQESLVDQLKQIASAFDFDREDYDYRCVDQFGYENSELKTKMFEGQVNDRVWYAKDMRLSYPVKIYIHRCSNYASYYNKVCFGALPKCEGGMSVCVKSPWRKNMSDTYTEIKGSKYMTSGRHFDYEEWVVAEEALKHQGAEFVVSQ
ncbi:hypothetical protein YASMINEVIRUS_1548, partial [Yasminevirus sp. GU-2018]